MRLGKDLEARVDQLAADLNTRVDELREEWSGRSERWQESDKGTAADGWLDEVGNLADELGNLEPQP